MRSREPQVARQEVTGRALFPTPALLAASPLPSHARRQARALTCLAFFPTDVEAEVRLPLSPLQLEWIRKGKYMS